MGTFTHDLSTGLTDYGRYDVAVKSVASGYEDSDTVHLAYDIGATIYIESNRYIKVSDVITGVVAFRLFVDDVEEDYVEYDNTAGWNIDLDNYDFADGRHIATLCAIGAAGSIADNRSNPVAFFSGVAPIYGVSGLYDSNRALTRTDDAVGMTYLINSSSGAIDSDFNNVFPWNEAEVVELSAGKFLRLPDMYFRIGVDAENRITDVAVSSMPSGGGDWYLVAGFDVACYGAGTNGSALNSVSGVSRRTNTTRANFRTYARNTGEGFYQYDLYHHTVLQFLWLIEWATKDSASVMTGRISGSGTSGGSSIRPTGGTDSVETPSGFETAYAQMRWHYIEDFVGNVREFIDGAINTSPSTPSYVTADPSKFSDSDTASMTALSYNNANTNNGNCIAALGWDSDNPFMCIPIETVNNSNFNTYFCDGYYCNVGNPVLNCGAYYSNANAGYGVFYMNSGSAGVSNTNLGARLLHSS